MDSNMNDELEDDEVIVLRAENQDGIHEDMLKYFEKPQSPENKKQNELPGTNQDLEGVCRICLGEEEDNIKNPLFSPCSCAGSMGLIHLDCLKEWLKIKKIQRQGEVVSTFFWKNLECELCKQRFPIEIELNNKEKHAILEYDLPIYEAGEQPHYIVLESISSNTSKVVHVLNFLEED